MIFDEVSSRAERRRYKSKVIGEWAGHFAVSPVDAIVAYARDTVRRDGLTRTDVGRVVQQLLSYAETMPDDGLKEL